MLDKSSVKALKTFLCTLNRYEGAIRELPTPQQRMVSNAASDLQINWPQALRKKHTIPGLGHAIRLKNSHGRFVLLLGPIRSRTR